MFDWLTTDGADLQRLAAQLKQSAQLSASKLMRTAGLSRQTLDHWSSGRSTPEPENFDRVGKALAMYGQRLEALGNDLIRRASEEEQQRRARQRQEPTDELSLFPTGTG